MLTPNPSLAKKHRRHLLSSLGSPAGLSYLDYLEGFFNVHLPVFQGKSGSFDPLDAMRRDAYREVFLYIRHQLTLALKEQPSYSTSSTKYDTITSKEIVNNPANNQPQTTLKNLK